MRRLLYLFILLHGKQTHKNREKFERSFEAVQQPFHYIFYSGTRGKIDCPLYDPGRKQKFQWRHNGKLVDTKDTRTVSTSGALEIVMRERYLGKYRCELIDEVSNATLDTSILIHLEMAFLNEFTVPSRDKHVDEQPNREVKMSCVIKGKPEPKITWYRKISRNNGFVQIVKINTNKFKISTSYNPASNQKCSNLTISSPQLSHQGEYSCRAMNTENSVNSSMYIIHILQKPKFRRKLRCPRPKLTDTHSVILKAIVEAENQELDISWTHNTSVITDSSKYEIKKSETNKSNGRIEITLNITRLAPTDSGIYVLSAKNYMGEQKSQCTLELEIPENVRYPIDQTKNIGEDAVIQCGGNQNIPYMIKFVPQYKSAEKVIAIIQKLRPGVLDTSCVSYTPPQHLNWMMEMADGGFLNLTIQNITYQNAGVYICSVKNSRNYEGHIEIKKKFVITENIIDVVLSKHLKHQERYCKARDAVSIQWYYVGHTNPAIQKLLDSAKEVAIDNEDSLIESFIEFNFDPKDYERLKGTYRCEAIANTGEKDVKEFQVTTCDGENNQVYGIEDSLRSVNITVTSIKNFQNIETLENFIAIEFTAPTCTAFITDYIIHFYDMVNELNVQDVVIPCMHSNQGAVDYNITKPGPRNMETLLQAFTIIPVYQKYFRRNPNFSFDRNYWTTKGELVASDSSTRALHKSGMAIGVIEISGNTVPKYSVPRVQNVHVNLDGTRLTIKWHFKALNPNIVIMAFKIMLRLGLHGQFEILNQQYEDGRQFSFSADLMKYFSGTSLNSGILYIEVRMEDMHLGLSEGTTYTLNLSELRTELRHYEIPMAVGLAILLLILFIVVAGTICRCHTSYTPKKEVDQTGDLLPIPPGGKGLKDNSRPLNDLASFQQSSLISLIEFNNDDHLPALSTSSVVNNHSVYYHEAALSEQMQKYRRKTSSRSRKKHFDIYRDPYDAETEPDSSRSMSSAHTSRRLSVEYQNALIDTSVRILDNRSEKPLAVVSPQPWPAEKIIENQSLPQSEMHPRKEGVMTNRCTTVPL